MNTRKLRKALMTLCAALLLVSLSVGITVAYLTDESTVVKNTFTVGNVEIKLDEAVVDENGKATAERTDSTIEDGNEYHLLPNLTYDKDPTVTVIKNSENSFVRVFVTVSDIEDIDTVFATHNLSIQDAVLGHDDTKWIPYGKAVEGEGTRTFELRYYQIVAKNTAADTVLEPVFQQIHVPGCVTNTELESLAEMTISVQAQAIQADGFASAEAAWGEW